MAELVSIFQHILKQQTALLVDEIFFALVLRAKKISRECQLDFYAGGLGISCVQHSIGTEPFAIILQDRSFDPIVQQALFVFRFVASLRIWAAIRVTTRTVLLLGFLLS